MIGDVGTPEVLIIVVVLLLLFGGSKLPDLARGSGRALRIFKAEVGRNDEDDHPSETGDRPSGSGVDTGGTA